MTRTPLENLFSELEELNRRIIELCCNHRRYADKIPDELNQYMAKAAYTEYLNQHEIHQQKLIMTVKAELYNLETIAAISTPTRRRRWYWPWSFKRNAAAQAVDANFGEAYGRFIGEILARADEMKETFCNAWAALLNSDPPAAETLQEDPESSCAHEEEPAKAQTTPDPPAAETLQEDLMTQDVPEEHTETEPMGPQEDPAAEDGVKPNETWEEEDAIPSQTGDGPSQG